MKKISLFCLCVMILVAGCFVIAPPKSQAEPITLTYSNFFPPTHIQSKLADAWCKEVEKRTNGRVKIQYFPGQTLTKATQNYDGVVQGLSDLGLMPFRVYPRPFSGDGSGGPSSGVSVGDGCDHGSK